MKTRNRFFVTVTACACLATATVVSQEKQGTSAKPDVAGGDWSKLASPGEHHRQLEPLVGKWNLVVKMREGPGSEWSESKGTAEFRWMFNGRFLIEEVKTELFGQPFEWMGVHGYDNAKKKHVSAWIDNLGTSIDAMDGICDDKLKTITYTGEFESMSGRSKLTWRIRLDARDRLVVEMLEPGPDGKEFVNTEIAGTRAP